MDVKDITHLLYNVLAEAAMRVATWVSTQTGVFESAPKYHLILLAILGAVYLRLS